MPDADRLFRLFYPNGMARRDEAKKKSMRFAHYTSAESAMKMIRSHQVWMRKSTTMNDFSEIEHGLSCVEKAWISPAAERFKAILEEKFPGIVETIIGLYNGWRPHFQMETYLTCISEHDDGPEDKYGRLSMWRAYGNVAIVLNPDVFMSETSALGAYSAPVDYLDEGEFAEKFEALVSNLEREKEFVGSQPRELVTQVVFAMLRFAVLSTKHPGFVEEREWRIYYSPTLEPSSVIKKEIETIRGTPQPVCKIVLADDPQRGLVGMEIPALINKIIIGPMEYPWVVAEAFVQLLADAGVADAPSKIVISDIPLRQ